MRLIWAASFLFAVHLVAGASLFGQATRTWVSGTGDDAYPCSRTAPCKTFAGAIAKTAAGGEINVLDPGGFGAVTITKSITIDGTGTAASILSAGVNGIVISAGVNDVVIVRGISINGAGTGINGIRFLSGGSLQVENVTMSGFSSNGIAFEPSGASQLSILNTTVRKAAYAAIIIKPSAAGSARVSIENCTTSRNTVGVRVEDGTVAFIKNTTAFGNVNNGFLAYSATGGTEMNLESCMTSGNGMNGIQSNGPYATVRISNVTCTGNGSGLNPINGGTIVSFGNNKVTGNTVDGPLPTVITMR